MASEQHDFIVALIARKVRTYGFEIVYQDGRTQNTDVKKLEIPPKIIHHKPDIVGKRDETEFCIGEAKTKNDIFSERTKNQIIDFLEIVKTDPSNRLIIGVPTSAIEDLKRVLIKLKVYEIKQLEIICVPEVLLPHEEEI